MAKDTPIELSALVAPAASFGEFLGSFLDTEKEYVEYLREGRKRYFFITSYSAVGTKKSPYVSPAEELVKDPFKGTYLRKPKKPKKGQRVGKDGRTSSQRLADIKRGPAKPSRFKLPELPKLPKVKVPPQAARLFGRSNAILNTITAGLEFSSRIESGQSLTKATLGTTASVVGGIAGASFGASQGATLGASIGLMFGGVGAVPGAVIGGAIGAIAGGYIGSGVASGVTDFATDAFGLEEGGVIKSATKSVIAETGIPEWLIPFEEIGKILIDSVFKPIGSVMIGAASSLMSILPTSTAMLALKGKIAKMKGIFGIEKIKPAIPGAVGGYGKIKTGVDIVLNAGVGLVSSLLGGGPVRAQVTNPSVIGNVNDMGTGDFGEGPLLRVAKEEGIEGKELAAFLAQLSHETGNFQFRRELSGGASHYGGGGPWTDAKGNTYPAKYHGRGYIQLTHDYNYKKYGDMFGVDLINNPDLAMDGELAAKIAVAYWKSTVRPRVAREGGGWDNVFAHSAAINYPGATDPSQINGYDDRVAKYNAYVKQLASAELEAKQIEALKEKPKPGARLTPSQWKSIEENITRMEKGEFKDLIGYMHRIAGVGTIQQGANLLGVPVVKYYDVNGNPISKDKWYDLLEKIKPEPNGGTGGPSGGNTSMNLSAAPPPESQPIERDVDQLNLPPEKRDQESMDAIEENSFSFVPIVIPGQTIPIQNIIEKVKYDSDISYFDPISHGVKTGRRIVL